MTPTLPEAPAWAGISDRPWTWAGSLASPRPGLCSDNRAGPGRASRKRWRPFAGTATTPRTRSKRLSLLPGAIGRFRGEAKFSTWLYRIAANRCLKHLARQPTPIGHPTERAGNLGNPEAEFEARERLHVIAKAVDRLTPAQRAPLLLREVEGLTYAEVAQILGVTVPAVKSRLNRARVELARALDESL